MSITCFWVGDNTETTCIVACRSDTTETITVTCNGELHTADADTAVNDGVVAVTVTGLVANKSYPFTVDGQAGTLKTANTTNSVSFATGSCWNNQTDAVSFKLLADYDLDYYIALGDFPYCNTSTARFGEAPTDVTDDLTANTTAENYHAHHRQIRLTGGIKQLMRKIPFMYSADDHEYPFDNAARDLTEYQNSPDITSWSSAESEANMNLGFDAAREAITAYSVGNIANGDASIDTDALYTRKTIGNGLVELFLIDCMNYRSAVSATDDAAKTMLGANQLAWLQARLLASTATYKVILTGKQFWDGGGNTDTWTKYNTELTALLSYINTLSITGVFALAGDQHFPNVEYKETPPMLCCVGCPTAQNLNTTQGVGYNTNIIYKYGKNAGAGVPEIRVCCLVEANSEYAEISLLSANRGKLWNGRIYAGSNELIYPTKQVSI